MNTKLNAVLIATVALLISVSCNKDKKGSATVSSDNTFNFNLTQQPTTLNPLSSTDYYASQVQGNIIEGMALRNVDTYEWQPALATEWETSPDGLMYTFKLREGVKWHDGKPFTAEDVKFTFDAIMHPKNKYKTAHSKPYFENIESCTILPDGRVQFKAKRKYFANFDVVVGMGIVPKHLYEDPSEEQEKQLNKTLVGTGPYTLDQWRRGKFIILNRNKDWWGNTVYPKQNNFASIRMRFIKEGNIAIQRLEKGDLDFNSLTAEEFVKKTGGKKWGKSVKKVKFENSAPKGYGFIGWNLRNPLFSSKDVRTALYMLVDREKMIEKYDYGLRLPATGPWYQQSIYADPTVKPIPFDPKKALSILRANGWKDTDGDQVLDKVINGKKTPFAFTILEPNKEFTKYLVTFQQDAKKAGINVQIKVVEWNTFITLLNERKFEAVRLGWSGGAVDYDPKQIWHSASATNKGSNFVNYSNKKVDQLIDKARETLDREKRIPILRQVYKLIAEDVPYAFLFNAKFGFYGYNSRINRPQDTFKFGVGTDYWTITKSIE
ncbi:MAG: ABC transporter substrate-binding protein [Halobacteriovoraceae bacterium]|jgi:peptide/nickel transport system substrate-binding protein/microcin C transport system substrate-binding protein|nr:ABC transporter substrate-binding protein [Halobacteriovoraceae bacterium]